MDSSTLGAGAGQQASTHADAVATGGRTRDLARGPLDTERVLRAATAIAAELRADRLPGTIARVLLEACGAQRACTLVPVGDAWVPTAVAEAGEHGVPPSSPGSEEPADAFASAVAMEVARTGHAIALTDPAEAGPFANDPHVRARRPRAVFGVPLRQRDRLVGVLELEHDAVVDNASEIVRCLELLAEQAATSLDTARRMAALETSEAQARRIITTADEGIVVLDRDGETITLVNARMAGLLGLGEAELIGRPFTTLMADEAEVGDHWRRIEARRYGLAEHYERRFRRADGTELWTLGSATPVIDEAGEYRGSFAMFTDITERKRAEHELALVSYALDQVGEAAFLSNEDGHFRLVNGAACRALGLDRDRLMAMAVWDIDPMTPHDAWRRRWELVRAQRFVTFGSQHRASDGRSFPVEISASYFEFGGRPQILALARDTEERARAEATIRQLNADLEATMAAIPDLLFEVDRDGRYLSVHARNPEMLAAPPAHVLGRTLAEVLPPDVAEVLMAGIRDAEEHGASYGGVIRLDLAGGPRYFEQSIARKAAVAEAVPTFVALSRDVTERIAAVEALEHSAEELRQSEERYRIVFDNVRESLFLLEVTEDGRFRNLEVNPALCASSGIPREAMIGRFIEETVLPETAAIVNEEYAACVAGGRIVETRSVLALPSGVRIYDSTLIPVRNREGRIDRLVGISHDVTERELAAEAQRATELKYQTLLEQASEAIFVNDADRRYTDVNIAACEILGYEREELLRLGVEDVTPPDLNPGQEGRFRRMLSGETVVTERMLRRKDGSLVPMELSTRRLPDGRYVAMGRDISERRRAAAEQARLVAAVEQAAEAIVITDPDGSIRYVNPAFEDLSGYVRDELLGHDPSMLSSGQHGDDFFAEMWAALLDGRTWRGTIINRRKDGTLIEEDTTISPIYDAKGELLGYAGAQRDVTRERALEAQLRQAQKIEAVGQLAGGIAHDFNNLVTAIRGYAELLRDGVGDDERSRSDLDQIVTASERAAELTRQLLAFSRRLPLQPRVVAPADIVARLAPMLRRLLGEHIDLVAAASPGSGRVLVDPSQLEQVIVNLAVNARDAMPHGGRLAIETAPVLLDGSSPHPELAPGPYVAIRTADTGSGMTEEVRRHAFEPFFTTKEAGKGTGMGLATVYGIVAASGGAITVRSAPGEGTEFLILLPRVEDESLADEGETYVPPAVPHGTETILLVEDEPGVRSFGRRALEALGYRVLEATNGVEALEVAAANADTIDLVVSDVVMPRLGGVALAQRLRLTQPGLRVLLVSGFAEDHLGAMEVRLDLPFLAKPFSREALGRTVRQVLDAAP